MTTKLSLLRRQVENQKRMIADRRRFLSRERDAAALQHDRVVEKQNALAKLRSQVAKLKRDAGRAEARVRLLLQNVHFSLKSPVQGVPPVQGAPSAGPSRLQDDSRSIRRSSWRRDRDRDDNSAPGSSVRNFSSRLYRTVH